MKSKLTFSPDVIEFIHNRSRQLIESSHSDEMGFFEDIWEIYEEHLEKWINKPPRKWKFRTSKLKIPNFLSVSGGPDTLNLITPKILEVISLSYAQIIALREYSLERIQEVISKCVKKLPKDIREETVNYLSPLIQKDSMKVLNISEEEIEKEIEMDSRLKPKKDEIPPEVEEKKQYWIYSHEKPMKPYPASKKEVDELENLSLEEKRKRFDIFFSEKKNEVITQGKIKDFTEGNKEATQLKIMLYLLLSKVGSFVEFEEIGLKIWGNQTQKSSDIHRLKDRLIKFTDGAIKPFLKSGKSLVRKDDRDDENDNGEIIEDDSDIGLSDRYYIKEYYKGKNLNYCMILCKDSVNFNED